MERPRDEQGRWVGPPPLPPPNLSLLGDAERPYSKKWPPPPPADPLLADRLTDGPRRPPASPPDSLALLGVTCAFLLAILVVTALGLWGLMWLAAHPL